MKNSDVGKTRAPSKKEKSGNKNTSGKKEINSVKLLYSVLGLAVLGLLILYGSGTFDEPAAVDNMSPSEFDQIHQGVDLNKVNQINQLEEEVKNNPNDLEKVAQLGHLLNDSGFYERAIEKYKMYLNAKPNDVDVMVDMGVCYFELKDYTNAISVMEKAIKINPKHQIGHFNLGIVQLSAGNRDKAVEYWKKCIDLDPSSRIAQRAQELLNNN